MEIRLIVDENVTSCAQLRIKRRDESTHFFSNGIDMVDKNMFIANYPPVYGHSFAGLVVAILEWYRDVDNRRVDNIESLLICDDSEACVCSPSCFDEEDEQAQWDAYNEEVQEKKKANKEELAKSDRAFGSLTWQEDKKVWEGTISI